MSAGYQWKQSPSNYFTLELVNVSWKICGVIEIDIFPQYEDPKGKFYSLISLNLPLLDILATVH